MPLAFPDDGGEMIVYQDTPKVVDLLHGRGGHIQTREGVERNQVDLGPDAGEQSDQSDGILIAVIYTFDENVLKGNHAPVWERKGLAGGN